MRAPSSGETPAPPDVPRAAPELCNVCGHCCNGVLYGEVPVESQEVEPLVQLGLTIRGKGPPHAFAQPCACHRDSRRTIYENRPQTCATYTRRVLKRYLAADTTLSESVAAVERVNAIVARLRTKVPGGALEDVGRRLRSLADPAEDEIEWRRRNAEALLDLMSLRQLRIRDFDPALYAKEKKPPT